MLNIPFTLICQYLANMASFKSRGVVGGGGGGRLGIAMIQLPQPSLAGTWAELGNKKQSHLSFLEAPNYLRATSA